MGSLKVSITALASEARELASENGENPEYDRALVELVNRASGLPDSARVLTARTLGVNQDPFLIPQSEPEPEPQPHLAVWQSEVANGNTTLGYTDWLAASVEPVPTEITFKIVLDLMPDDDVEIAVHDYFVEHPIPEPVSVIPLDDDKES